jgi:type IV secretory pathway VirJ component
MKRSICCLLFLSVVPFLAAKEDTLSFGRFGQVTLYYEKPQPAHVALFVSGDGGWNRGVVDMARQLAMLDTMVVGIDVTRFIKQMESSTQKCLYPAADFEALSKFVQLKLNFPTYRTPVLVGYSSGATLVYAALVQAPPNTFLGGIGLGFCPDLMLHKPMCRGSGLEWTSGPKGKGYVFLPAETLEVPWTALQGTVDQVCNAALTESFVKKVSQGEVVVLPKVGHGFSVPRNWLPQFKEAFTRITAREEKVEGLPKTVSDGSSEPVSDLPLIEVPATAGNSDLMGIIITGDGGWSATDRGIARSLAAEGIPVVALNSLRYFWTRKTVEQTAEDLNRLLRHYSALWKRTEALVIGYSFGADVLPFMLNRLPEESLQRVKVIAFLGLSSTADFEFHLTDWISDRKRSTSKMVQPEVEKLRGRKMLCFYGTEDTSLCRQLDPGLVQRIPIPGGHRFGSGYQPIVDAILKELRQSGSP